MSFLTFLSGIFFFYEDKEINFIFRVSSKKNKHFNLNIYIYIYTRKSYKKGLYHRMVDGLTHTSIISTQGRRRGMGKLGSSPNHCLCSSTFF